MVLLFRRGRDDWSMFHNEETPGLFLDAAILFADTLQLASNSVIHLLSYFH